VEVLQNGKEMDPQTQALSEALMRITQHQDAGRFTEAGKLLDETLVNYPDNAKLTHYKGYNLIRTGDPEQGRALMDLALEVLPEDPVQLADIGAVLAQSGDLDGALEKFRLATEFAPNYAIAQSNLGGALVLKKKFGEAIQHLEKAVELEPRLMDAHTNLSFAYMQVNNFDKAIDSLFKALSIDPQSVGAHTQLSAALFRRERYESAEHHARRAIELMPGAAEPYLHLGNALASSGKMEEAAEVLLKIAGRPPVGMPALSRLIHLRKTKADSPELAILEKLLERSADMGPEQQSTLHFAAGKAYDDLGDYPRAFTHFKTANDITRELHAFDATLMIERAERLLEFCSPALLKRCAGEGVTDVAPVFICGMPRSGTTLMDQMFSRHPDVQAGGELRAAVQALHQNTRIRAALEEKLPDEEIVADDFNRLGEAYVSSLRQEGIRSTFMTDKMPSNYRHIGLLSLALPRAKFLIMRRHPLDCLLSNYVQHFGANQPFSSDFNNLAAVYKEFDRTAKAWLNRLPDRVREVSYEAVTEDAEAQMRDVLNFVGLDWNPDVLDHKASSRQVNTASLAQVREPIYKSSVARWRRYGTAMAPLATQLQDFLTVEELAACGVA